MATITTPHFQNDAGMQVILTGAKEFMCIGATPPFDHPHAFLDMGSDDEIVCPYCSTLYRFDPSLKPGEAVPKSAIWHDPRHDAADEIGPRGSGLR